MTSEALRTRIAYAFSLIYPDTPPIIDLRDDETIHVIVTSHTRFRAEIDDDDFLRFTPYDPTDPERIADDVTITVRIADDA